MSPRSEEQNLQIKDRRREEILSAALKIFAKGGLAATKISDIASEANLSHGLIYHYFDSKEDLFIQLVKRAVDISSKTLLKFETLQLNPVLKIKKITESVLTGIEQDEDSAYYFLLMIQASLSESNPEKVKEYLKKATVPVEVVSRIVTKGQKRGLISPGDPIKRVMVYWAAIQGIAMYKISMGPNFKMPDADLFMNILK